MNAETVAAAYFANMRARDLDGIGALFSADAVFVLPDGREHAGRDAILAMYRYLFEAGSPVPTPVATVATATVAAVEIEAGMPDGTVRNTANFFHLDDAGLIVRLSVYRRGF